MKDFKIIKKTQITPDKIAFEAELLDGKSFNYKKYFGAMVAHGLTWFDGSTMVAIDKLEHHGRRFTGIVKNLRTN